jgi:hypothetical protein
VELSLLPTGGEDLVGDVARVGVLEGLLLQLGLMGVWGRSAARASLISATAPCAEESILLASSEGTFYNV